jgi:DNA-binding response OmpR family regulator
MPERMPRLILVVENDPPLLQALAETVTQLGFDATLATTAADGLTLAEVARPDAILLDVGVPELTGRSTLDRLKTIHPDVPVIMLASPATEAFAREALKHGAFDYVVRPLNVSHLTEVLRAAVRRTG